jgi:PAS domain S-box-containing protein
MAHTSTNRVLIVSAVVAATILVLSAIIYSFNVHWWIPVSTIDIARIVETVGGTQVRFNGSVTFVDVDNNIAVLQDDSGATVVSIPKEAPVNFGAEIQLSGTIPTNYDPTALVPLTLDNLNVTVIRNKAPLATRKTSAVTEVMSGFDPVRFEVSGIVTGIREQGGRVQMDITNSGTNLLIAFHQGKYAELAKLIDAKITVRGVRFMDFTANFRYMLLAYDANDVTLIEPPASSTPLVASLPTLLSDPKWQQSGHRVRLRGKVQRILTNRSLLLTDGSMSVPIESTSELNATLDSIIEIEAWPNIWEHAVVMQGAIIVARDVIAPAFRRRAPLNNSEKVRQLSRDDANQALPVQISGVVTAATTAVGIVFVQDAQGGVYIRAPNQPLPLSLGQRVVVRGVTQQGAATPIVVNAMFETAEASVLPTPVKPTADDLGNGAFDFMYAEIEGKVRSISTPYPGLTVFKLLTGQGTAIDFTGTDIPPSIDPTSLIDAKVRVHGVLSSVFNMDQRIVGRRLSAFPLKALQVLSPPPPNPFTVAATPIEKLLRDINTFTSSRTHVSGTVIMTTGNLLYIQDNTGGLQVDVSTSTVRPRVGDVISAAGYATPGAYGPTLIDAEIRKTGTAALPTPASITSQEAMTGQYEYRLIEIEAKVLGTIGGTQVQRLVLNSGGYNFEADVHQRAPLSLADGTVIRLKGVCTTQAVHTGITRSPTGFRILARDDSQIHIIKSAPWLSGRSAIYLLGATALITLAVLAWVWALRRRVSIQTREIESQRQFLRQVIDIAPDFIFAKDTQGQVTLANHAIAEAYRVQPQDMVGKRIQQISANAADTILHDNDDREVVESLNEKYIAETSHVDVDGKQRWMQITKRPMLGANGKAVGVLAVAHDITHRKLDEVRLQQARAAAESANLAKSEFLANMSHEIRTPLNGIIGMTQLALDTTLNAEQRDYLQTVRLSADSLLNVVNDILDFSKIEAGKLELDCYDFDLRDGLQSTLKTVSLAAFSKKLELICDVHPDVAASMNGDMPRLRQVLLNLLSNAIKFTERGEVTVKVTVEDANAKGQLLHFVVIDSGIGIPDNKLRTIFEPFAQADGSTTRKYGGTGLGLTISTRLVELFGGKIWVESTVGQGSAFHFTAQFAQATAIKPALDIDASLVGRRILIVDDNPNARVITVQMAERSKMIVTAVASDTEALAAINSALLNQTPFDLALVDQDLGSVEGTTLIESLRARPDVRTQFVAALNAANQREATIHCKRLGVRAQVIKPIAEQPLCAALVRALHIAADDAEPVAQSQTQSIQLGKLNALIAEDNPVNQLLLKRLLEKRGHRVTVVGDGLAAVNIVKEQRFDVVFMDVQMPVLDGLDATTRIRADERLGDYSIPIIALTAHAMKGDRERCLAAGMSDYLSKPVVPNELDDALLHVVSGAMRKTRIAVS